MDTGETPLAKNAIWLITRISPPLCLPFAAKGMTPIAKNINVVDEQGKVYEATHIKRAKGFVKKGRARFIDGNTIMFACPPNTYLEDDEMSENNMTNSATEAYSEGFEAALRQNPEAGAAPNGFDPEFMLSRMLKFFEDTKHIGEAMDSLKSMEFGSQNQGIGDQAKAASIAKIVEHREATNQQVLRFIEKMYDDLKPPKAPEPLNLGQLNVQAIIDSLPPGEKESVILELARGFGSSGNASGKPFEMFKDILNEIRSVDWESVPDDVKEAVCEGISSQLSRNW